MKSQSETRLVNAEIQTEEIEATIGRVVSIQLVISSDNLSNSKLHVVEFKNNQSKTRLVNAEIQTNEAEAGKWQRKGKLDLLLFL